MTQVMRAIGLDLKGFSQEDHHTQTVVLYLGILRSFSPYILVLPNTKEARTVENYT
jgi:hypothetical protein